MNGLYIDLKPITPSQMCDLTNLKLIEINIDFWFINNFKSHVTVRKILKKQLDGSTTFKLFFEVAEPPMWLKEVFRPLLKAPTIIQMAQVWFGQLKAGYLKVTKLLLWPLIMDESGFSHAKTKQRLIVHSFVYIQWRAPTITSKGSSIDCKPHFIKRIS